MYFDVSPSSEQIRSESKISAGGTVVDGSQITIDRQIDAVIDQTDRAIAEEIERSTSVQAAEAGGQAALALAVVTVLCKRRCWYAAGCGISENIGLAGDDCA